MGVLTDTEEVYAILSPRLRTNFNTPSALLTVVIFSTVVASLIVSLGISMRQAVHDRQRQLLEARAAKARRLLYVASKQPCLPAPLPQQPTRPQPSSSRDSAASQEAHYHIFLSHVWSTAQDQMRIVRTRLLEMMPELSVFLDVEDLKDISDLEGYIERSSVILVMCTKGYFSSKNCMRELRCAVGMGKPMFAMLDLDSDTRSLTMEEVKAELLAADAKFAGWGFSGDGGPDGAACFAALFAVDPIEWNRIGVFQDVTMRLVAERTLPEGHGATFLAGESTQAKVSVPSLRRGRSYHLYVSPSNLQAAEFVVELAEWLDDRQVAAKAEAAAKSQLKIAHDLEALEGCEAMLLYLNGLTWTSEGHTAALSYEVAHAMRLGIPVLLAHEMPGLGGQESRFGVPFSAFFDSSATPIELIKAGIYATIAVPLKGGAWRGASLVEMLRAIKAAPEERGEPTHAAIEAAAALSLQDKAAPSARQSRGRKSSIAIRMQWMRDSSSSSMSAAHQDAGQAAATTTTRAQRREAMEARLNGSKIRSSLRRLSLVAARSRDRRRSHLDDVDDDEAYAADEAAEADDAAGELPGGAQTNRGGALTNRGGALTNRGLRMDRPRRAGTSEAPPSFRGSRWGGSENTTTSTAVVRTGPASPRAAAGVEIEHQHEEPPHGEPLDRAVPNGGPRSTSEVRRSSASEMLSPRQLPAPRRRYSLRDGGIAAQPEGTSEAGAEADEQDEEVVYLPMVSRAAVRSVSGCIDADADRRAAPHVRAGDELHTFESVAEGEQGATFVDEDAPLVQCV